MPDIDKSYQELIITNFGLSPSGYTGSIGAVGATGPAGGYTGSRGDVGYVGSAGPGMSMTTDTFTGDGTTTAFVLTTTPDSINRTIVNYNGVTVLRSAYTLSSATITFSSAPAAGSQIEITTINSASGSGGATGTALKITTVGYVGNNTATDTAGGETVTLTGTGFVTGASVIINGVAAGVVTVASATQLTFTAPAMAAGTYIFYVVNTDGATAISVPGISYSGVPSFYVGAGSVGSVYEASSFNSNVSAVGDSAITYSIASGSLPAGATLNANGIITGSSVLTASPTTYTFGVNASDGQNQDVTRSYTITVNPDTVTWSTPANNATVTLGQNSSTSTSLTAVSAAGKAITYTANALPTGLSIVGSAVTGTPTVLGNTTTVLTATATDTTRTATVTVVWNVAVTGEPYFAYNSLLLSGNGSNNANNNTFLDSSSNNFAITRNGNTTQGTFSPYGPNWSNYLASGDSLTLSSSISLGSTWTIECWYNINASGNNIISFDSGSSDFWLGVYPTVINYAYSGNLRSFAFTSAVNTWYHLALVNNAGTITCYVNGVQVGTTQAGPSASTLNRIGGYTGIYNFAGYLSNLRVTNTAVYTSAFTPSTTPLTAISGTQLLTCQSNRFIDNSASPYTITATSAVSVQRFSPFSPSAPYSTSTIGGSGFFDGTVDSLSFSANSSMSFSGNLTVEAWVYVRSYTGSAYNECTLLSLRTAGGGSQFNWARSNGAVPGSIGWYNNGSVCDSNTAGDIPLNRWTHIAWVRNGTATNNCKIYVNGVQRAQGSDNTAMGVSSGTCWVGNSMYDQPMDGYVSDLRITNTAVYTGAFTPPTTPLTAIPGTVFLLPFTNAGIIDNTMMNNLETVGNAQISSAQTKFGGGSMSFDGSGDWLFMSPNRNNDLGTGNFTIEMWIYPTAALNTFRMLMAKATNTDETYISLSAGGTGGLLDVYGGSIVFNLNNSISLNTWAHLAIVRVGNTWTAYVNGTSLGSNTSSVAFNLSGIYGTYIGRYGHNPAYEWNGYIDDLRITKGYARYTANFTPPTTALSTQ